MSYLVLARKYRPMSFDDLVGQEHVARTLSNAIAAGRVAHAFLFTGVRGVGKTTSARIMAKALNCEKGPTATPCLKCAACIEIAAGVDVDVQEIDGASYNGVDEVRKLQESLPYRPQRDRHKIYIVDEVHMLSNAAWNAFLKTLEEPPPHVKFIFATTEVHKVPVTILSRCQRFDFKLIGTKEIAACLSKVLTKEKIKAESSALHLLAREAAGSMRDAMSLLDQVISWSEEGGLTVDGVSSVLGVAPHATLAALAEAVVRGDASSAVRKLGEVADAGFDIIHVARDLLSLFRDYTVLKTCGPEGDVLQAPATELEAMSKVVADVSADDLGRLFLGLSRSFDEIARGGQPRWALEMCLIRLSRRPSLEPLADLIARLGELERRLGAAGGAGGSSGPSSGSPVPGRSVGGGGPPTPAAAPRSALPASTVAVQVAATALGVDWELWRRIVGELRTENAARASIFEHARLLEVSLERIRVAYEPNSFLAAQALEPEAQRELARAVKRAAARDIAVDVGVMRVDSTVRSLAEIEGDKRRAELEALRQKTLNHPLVRAAIEVLGAEVKDVIFPGDN